MATEASFELRSLRPKHTCSRVYKNSIVNSRWISDKLYDKFKIQPDMPLRVIQDEVKRKWNVEVSRSQMYRGRKKAGKRLYSCLGEQYGKLWDYCETLRRTNPGSCVMIKVEKTNPNLPTKFHRLYMSLAAMKKWFLEGCRPVIGLDGCFLKGPYKGILLVVGVALKELLWKAASSYTEVDFKIHMEEIKRISLDAFDYLDKARDKPILTILEMIRKQLMRRYQLKIDGISKLKGKLCPRIVEKLESVCEAASDCLSCYSGNGMFEVEQRSRQYVVDIQNRKCGCRRWQMTGIPCTHAHSAITYHGHHPEDYMDSCYSIETYKKAYAPLIYPMPSEEQWIGTEHDVLDPPRSRLMTGIPRKVRVRGPDESRVPQNPYRMRKFGLKGNCGLCKESDLVGLRLPSWNRQPTAPRPPPPPPMRESSRIKNMFRTVPINPQPPVFIDLTARSIAARDT
ncbi:uncharacterized protein LOC133871483 [Alnus glutinosa]|uniref:uncharacterized protein LOC133871483 n=1 Tax=Alnus glutinosa TaxID=3517 RepID=UPI002D78D6B8|nr:uncharacterized protein LOC133871483 [Alnus glutinosa]